MIRDWGDLGWCCRERIREEVRVQLQFQLRIGEDPKLGRHYFLGRTQLRGLTDQYLRIVWVSMV